MTVGLGAGAHDAESPGKHIAVIGAGWAGLAAALGLKDLGARVTVFEAAPVPGGRARGVDDVNMGRIDNGQHLMLGAYSETLRLIERLHPEQTLERRVLRRPLHLESADGMFELHAPASLPAPVNTLWALLTAKGLTLKTDRMGALFMMMRCRLSGWRALPNETVADLLKRYKQSAQLHHRLWTPLCLAALNTPIEQACAQLFLNILRDSLDKKRQDSDLLIPRLDLTELWPAAAASHLDMRYRHIVRSLSIEPNHVEIDSERFDACVLATPPYAAARLLFNDLASGDPQRAQQQQLGQDLHTQLNCFKYRAIATLTLELESAWRLPQPMMMLDEDHSKNEFGQWVFNRPDQAHQLTVVISDAADFLKHDRQTFVQAIASQIRHQSMQHPKSQTLMPGIKHHRLIVEKRATFDAVPGLVRPANQSPWPRLTLAGDWTDTGYPSVLEGAVRSGQAAALQLMHQFSSSRLKI